MHLTRKTVAIVLLSIVVGAAVVYAAIVYTRNITSTLTIVPVDELSVRDPVTNEEITQWTIGEAHRNSEYTLSCLIEYTGDNPDGRYVMWECPDLPAGMTLTAKFYDNAWQNWGEGVKLGPLTTQVIQANFTLNTGDVANGDYSFTLKVEATDS